MAVIKGPRLMVHLSDMSTLVPNGIWPRIMNANKGRSRSLLYRFRNVMEPSKTPRYVLYPSKMSTTLVSVLSSVHSSLMVFSKIKNHVYELCFSCSKSESHILR